MIMLYTIILRHFQGDLNREYGLTVACQSALAVSFITRCVLIGLVDIGLWVDFNRDYPDAKGTPLTWAMLPLEFILYNIIPYMMLLCAHWYNATRSETKTANALRSVNHSIFDSNRYMGHD